MSPLQKELSVALRAVVLASHLTQHVFHAQHSQGTLPGTATKQDKSPVTVADYGSQALVNAVLRQNFPEDRIVGEEDSGELRHNGELRQTVWELVQKTLDARDEQGLRIKSVEDMLDLIDLGGSEGGATGSMIHC
jgi:3'(2'), 5'-bisphosphate nucleotidase